MRESLVLPDSIRVSVIITDFCLRVYTIMQNNPRTTVRTIANVKMPSKAHGNNGQVDIPLTGYAPHRTGRAAFPHPALYKTDSSTAVLHIHLHRFSVLPMGIPLAFR